VKAIKQQHPEASSRLRGSQRSGLPPPKEKERGGIKRKGEKENKVIMILISIDKQKEEKMG
jgi:hypothetical protein